MIEQGRKNDRPRRRQRLQNGIPVLDREGYQQASRRTQEGQGEGDLRPSPKVPRVATSLPEQEEEVDGQTPQRELKVPLPDGQRTLALVGLDDLLKINGREAAQGDLRQDRERAQREVPPVALLLPGAAVIPSRFGEEQDADDEGEERPPLGPGVGALEHEGGETGRGEDFELGADGEYSSGDVSERDVGEDVHDAVDEGKHEHFLRGAREVRQVRGEGGASGGVVAFVGFVDDVGGEEEFDDLPEEEDFVLGVGLLEDALTVPPQDGEEGVLEAEN